MAIGSENPRFSELTAKSVVCQTALEVEDPSSGEVHELPLATISAQPKQGRTTLVKFGGVDPRQLQEADVRVAQINTQALPLLANLRQHHRMFLLVNLTFVAHLHTWVGIETPWLEIHKYARVRVSDVFGTHANDTLASVMLRTVRTFSSVQSNFHGIIDTAKNATKLPVNFSAASATWNGGIDLGQAWVHTMELTNKTEDITPSLTMAKLMNAVRIAAKETYLGSIAICGDNDIELRTRPPEWVMKVFADLREIS
eukprot:COSAG02_NODE_11053_length_1804_cov_2.583578_2_plen_255_part_01